MNERNRRYPMGAGSGMTKLQAEKVADLVILASKMKADPVMVRFKKLNEFALYAGLEIRMDNEMFQLCQGEKVLVECASTEELNEWFKKNYGEDVLD